MGLHTGEPQISASENYCGHRCSSRRTIAAAAYGGQVLLSQPTYELVGNELPEGVTVRDLGEHNLKDLRRSKHLYQLVMAGLRSDFLRSSRKRQPRIICRFNLLVLSGAQRKLARLSSCFLTGDW